MGYLPVFPGFWLVFPPGRFRLGSMTMVIFRSNVSTTKTRRHRGLRRGAAAAALGVVLAVTAGVPASHAATGLSAAASTPSAQGSLTLGLDDVLGSLLGSSPSPSSPSPSSDSDEATPSPSPSPSRRSSSPEPTSPEPSSPEPSTPQPGTPAPTRPARPALRPPALPAPPSPRPPDRRSRALRSPHRPRESAAGGFPGRAGPRPAWLRAPVPARPPGPSPEPRRPEATRRAGAAPCVAVEICRAAAFTGRLEQRRLHHGAGSHGPSGSTSLEATSAVEPAGPSPLIGWGICLVALSLGAGAAYVRMRKS